MQKLNFEILIFYFSPNRKYHKLYYIKDQKSSRILCTQLDWTLPKIPKTFYVLNFLQLYFSTETRW